MLVDQHWFDGGVGAQLLHSRVGQRTPATSAGPDGGTWTANTGLAANVGVSTCSATTTASHIPTRALDEAALVGKAANIEAWRGYASSFPDYVIHPYQFSEVNGCVAVLGHTTGSHRGLPDHEERRLTVMWVAHVDRGLLDRWSIVEATPGRRSEFGLDAGG
jgi:hypothetical protein